MRFWIEKRFLQALQAMMRFIAKAWDDPGWFAIYHKAEEMRLSDDNTIAFDACLRHKDVRSRRSCRTYLSLFVSRTFLDLVHFESGLCLVTLCVVDLRTKGLVAIQTGHVTLSPVRV